MLELILDVKSRGIPIILISHNMPHVFEVADRIHVHRLGRRLCVIRPQNHTMSAAEIDVPTIVPPSTREASRSSSATSAGRPSVTDAWSLASVLNRIGRATAPNAGFPCDSNSMT